MAVKNPEYHRLLQALKEEGYRITGPRRALLRVFASSTTPLSVQEMYTHVNQQLGAEEGEEEINVVTIYRFANLLVELRLLRRVEFGQGYFRYEREESQDGPHHHHIVCEKCGRVEDFHGCGIAELEERLEKESGFKIARHQLELFGTCPTCQTAA